MKGRSKIDFIPFKAITLLQLSFLCASVVFVYGVCFASICSSSLISFWCLGNVVLRNCGIFWVSSLIFSRVLVHCIYVGYFCGFVS